MAIRIDQIRIRRFRSLADITLDLRDIGVLFGRNGAGKSTLLDTFWFARDCGARNVEMASASRSHGIGLLFDGADDDAHLALGLTCGKVSYDLEFAFANGKIDPAPGERLLVEGKGNPLLARAVGSSKATFDLPRFAASTFELREPEKLCLSRYADLDQTGAAAHIDNVLRYVHKYDARRFFLNRIKGQGSESSYETSLWEYGDNLWSVLRNLRDKSRVDDRFDTILHHMREAFPDSFDDIQFEQTGPNSVYGSFLEKGRRRPIAASGVSDGHLQMLLLLTALFSEGKGRGSLLMFDEPEISLHPWAIAAFARAAREAASLWDKQILVATHSPVLLSQFEADEVLVAEMDAGRTHIRRLSEVAEVQDLLADYAIGSLYMSDMVAGQGPQSSDASRG